MDRFSPASIISINPLAILLQSLRGIFQTKASIARHVREVEDKDEAVRDGIKKMQYRTAVEVKNILKALYTIANKAKQSPSETEKRAEKRATIQTARAIASIRKRLDSYQRDESAKMVAQDKMANDTEPKPRERVSLAAMSRKNTELCEECISIFSGMMAKATTEKQKKDAIVAMFLTKKYKGKPRGNIFSELASRIDSQLSLGGNVGLEKTDATYSEPATSLKEFKRVVEQIVTQIQKIKITYAPSRADEELLSLANMGELLQNTIINIYTIKANGYDALEKILPIFGPTHQDPAHKKEYTAEIFDQLAKVASELIDTLHLVEKYSPARTHSGNVPKAIKFLTTVDVKPQYTTHGEWMASCIDKLTRCKDITDSILQSTQFATLSKLALFIESLPVRSRQNLLSSPFLKDRINAYPDFFADLLVAFNHAAEIEDDINKKQQSTLLPAILHSLQKAFEEKDTALVYYIYGKIRNLEDRTVLDGIDVYLKRNPEVKSFVEKALTSPKFRSKENIGAIKKALEKTTP